jgi:hypothetical protein
MSRVIGSQRERELERSRIDTVAFMCGRWAITEDMAQMGIALSAQYLHTAHAMTRIQLRNNTFLPHRRPKTGPASAGVEFRIGTEQWRPAAHTMIDPAIFAIVIFSRKSTFRTLTAAYRKLIRGQQLLPFLVRLHNFLHNSIHSGNINFYKEYLPRYVCCT